MEKNSGFKIEKKESVKVLVKWFFLSNYYLLANKDEKYYGGMLIFWTKSFITLKRFQIVGSETFEDFRSAAIYNVAKNTWTLLEKTSVLREGTDLVVLGQRTFAIGGLSNTTDEFHLGTNSWTSINENLIIPRIQHNSISLPASIFSEISGGCQGIF